jgi:hypothetical protein
MTPKKTGRVHDSLSDTRDQNENAGGIFILK